jgi:hypothetical protein
VIAFRRGASRVGSGASRRKRRRLYGSAAFRYGFGEASLAAAEGPLEKGAAILFPTGTPA